MLRQVHIERQAAQHPRRGDTGNDDRRQQRGDDYVEQIIPCIDGSDPDDYADQDIKQAGAGDVVIHCLAHAARDNSPRQVRNGRESDKRR